MRGVAAGCSSHRRTLPSGSSWPRRDRSPGRVVGRLPGKLLAAIGQLHEISKGSKYPHLVTCELPQRTLKLQLLRLPLMGVSGVPKTTGTRHLLRDIKQIEVCGGISEDIVDTFVHCVELVLRCPWEVDKKKGKTITDYRCSIRGVFPLLSRANLPTRHYSWWGSAGKFSRLPFESPCRDTWP